MNIPLPNQIPTDNGFDEELMLTFLTQYQALEQALVRAGFTRAGRMPGNHRPDWEQFSRHIQTKFDPQPSPELMGAAWYLLGQPGKQELRWKRSEDAFRVEPASPERDVLWLSELVQEVHNRLLAWINFAEGVPSDDASVVAALFLIEAWSAIDPQVKSLLAYSSSA